MARKQTSKKKTRTSGKKVKQGAARRRKKVSAAERPNIVTGVYDPGAVSSGAPLYLDVEAGLVPGEVAAESPQKPGPGWKIPAAVGALAALVLVAFIVWFPRRTIGPLAGELRAPGISKVVSISRDKLGVPFIQAENEDDLFFAVGYAMAQDRMWQMELLKRTALGRLAEVFGPGLLDFDVYVRTIGLALAANESFARLPAQHRRVLERFALGVNHYRTTQAKPIEFTLAGITPEVWSPADCLAVFAVMKLDLSSNLREELAFLKLAQALGPERAAMLFPSYPGEPLPLAAAAQLRGLDLSSAAPRAQALRLMEGVLVDSSMGASNNWALAPARTRGGASIVANDTHLGISMPSAWMLLNLKSPTYRAAGVAVPGVPLVALGYNGHIAWGATMVMADNQDLFLEQLRVNTAGQREYLDRGNWRPVIQRRERFAIKGGETVERIVESTRRGPLLNEVIGGKNVLPYQPVPFSLKLGVSLRWSNADGDRSAQGFYDMGRARTISEARRALSLIDTIFLNVVMGDRHNIAYQTTGRLPRRRQGRGHLPVPGWTGAYDWDGYLPFAAQPYQLNPREGYLATANHRVSTRQPPYHISSSWAGPERMERVRALLQRERAGTLQGTTSMHMDVVSHMALKVKTLLTSAAFNGELKAAAARLGPDADKRVRSALDMIASFDGNMQPNSAAAALMGSFYYHLPRELLMDELGPESGELWSAYHTGSIGYGAPEDHLFSRPDSPFWDDVGTKDKREGRADIVARSLAAAYASCEDEMGNPTRWQWGKLHRYEWRHTFTARAGWLGWYLNRGPIAAPGDLHTINNTGFKWGKDQRITLISAMRLVVDFSQPDPAFLITHSGQSGNPASRAYDSMIPYFMEGKQHPLPFDQNNIEKQYGSRLRLLPASGP